MRRTRPLVAIVLSFAIITEASSAARADTPPPGLARMPDGVPLQCEDFPLQGKWKVGSDPEYAGATGLGYITETASAGIAGFAPGADVPINTPGRYHVWIRAYLGGPPNQGMHDRELYVSVNGQPLPPTHRGLEGDRFTWELAGTVTLPAGEARVAVHDRGRRAAVADCILLTGDLAFKPTEWTGNSRRPAPSVPFDPPDVEPTPTEPYQRPKAQHEHIEAITGPEHGYQVTMGGTLDEFNTAAFPETYGMNTRLESRYQPNRYVVIENTGEHDVDSPWLVADGRRDWFSADRLLAGLFTPDMTDAEKAMAIWRHCGSNWVQCHDNNRRVGPYYPEPHAHPWRNTFKERANPVKAANLYYCSGCQLSAANCTVLMRRAGLPARAVWMCPRGMFEIHCVCEAWYDDAWHLFDPERRSFYLEADNTTVASYESLHKNPHLASRGHDGGFAAPSGKRTHAKEYERFYPPPVMPVGRWVSRMDMTLRPGERLVYRWTHDGKFRRGQNPRNRNYRPYQLSNGKLIYQPDLSRPVSRHAMLSEDNLKAVYEDGNRPAVHPEIAREPAFVSYRMKTAYPIVGGAIGGTFHRKSQGDVARILLSIGDSDWVEVWSADQTGDVRVCLAVDALMGVKPSAAWYECYVKYEMRAADETTDVGLEAVYLELDLQMSQLALPSLAVGENAMVYRDKTDGPRRVHITHGWEENAATRPPTAPDKPIVPIDGATLAADALPELQWEPADDPDGQGIQEYHVQVSPRADMLHPISPNFDRRTFAADSRWDVPSGWFVDGHAYHWRVRARDQWGAWGPWSDVWRFRIESGPKEKRKTTEST